MNERVEERLNNIKSKAEDIIATCRNIINDLEEVETCMDLGVIESGFSAIERMADREIKYVQETWDYFEE